MIVNFSHPLTDEQIEQLQDLGISGPVKNIRVQVDQDAPMARQATLIVTQAALPLDAWKNAVVVLPGLAIVAALIIQEIKDMTELDEVRIVRLKPVNLPVGVKFVVAEIISM